MDQSSLELPVLKRSALTHLAIRDVVLIDRLGLGFRQGLTVLTGETGAGKSILLDALGLALGGRGGAGLVRHGAEQAGVTAEFDVSPEHPALALLREQGLEAEERVVVRRTVSADGRSRAWINDQPVGVALLKQIGAELVEIHGQFDTQGLLNPATHRDVLDSFAGDVYAVARVAAAWRAWRQVEDARAKAAAEATRARAEEDYLRHAAAELDELDPRLGEEKELAESRAVLMHREKLLDALSAASTELSGDRGAERALAGAARTLARVADKAGGRLDEALAALDRAAAEASEAAHALRALSADMDNEGGSLDKLEERLFALRAAARKHGTDVDGLAALRDDFARRLSLIEDQGDLLTRLAREADVARRGYVDAAEALGKIRRAAASRIDAAVAAELAPLKMERARFVTQVDAADESEWGPGGTDRVAFLVATNPGAPPGQINKIASGGELARFMLALKVALSETNSVGTMVFDEVDTGIGGAVAAAVGERLERLGRRVQVLVVTHSPQVAARGVHHLKVRKTVSGDIAATSVGELSDDERREEIARMLSGAEITAEARAAAERLIAGRG